MKVRCKFVCSYKDEKTGQLSFSPVYSGSDENKAFFAATPGGNINFYSTNAAAFNAFETGKEYYVIFEKAPE